jgi:uncharacterized membrane protein
VDALLDDITRAYDRGIQAPGKETHFLVLLAFIASFGFIRTSTHMIRAQVSWWPGNVETKGGTHVHHLVWGILLLIFSGYVGIALDPESPWRELVAIFFGIGLGLTLDEFALWLNLEDVYWSEKGRQSIDAVIVTACLLTITLLGLSFWIDVLQAVLISLGVGGRSLSGGESAAVLVPLQLAGASLALVCFLKGKRFAGIVGVFVPLAALVGAVRLAKPGSRWARRYAGPKLERSRARFAGAPG